MFSGQALQEKMERVVNTHATLAVELLRKDVVETNKTIDMQEVFQCAIFDAFCEIAFGISPDGLQMAMEGKKPAFQVSFDFCQTKMFKRAFLLPCMWNFERLVGTFTGMTEEGELIKHFKVLDDYLYPIIRERLV